MALIKQFAFYECASLTSVTIPDSVTYIGINAFQGCTSLKEVYYNGDLSAWCKINFEGDKANPMNNGAKLYIDNIELTEVTIPSEIIEINDSFTGCTSLTSVTFHKRVTLIGSCAFSGCSSLTNITIFDSVTNVGCEAFKGCTSLKDIYYNGDLSAWCKTNFGDFTANPMCNGAKLYLNGMELTNAIIPSEITEIKDYAFRGCSSLKSVVIPDNVIEIGKYAFRDCSSLTSVTISNSVTSIGDAAFMNCSLLTNIPIGNSVTDIGEHAFYKCSSLTRITIPESVTSIGESAFEYCSSIKEVYCKPTTPPNGGNYIFINNASDRKIYVPRASVETYKSAKYWSVYADYIVGYDF